MKYILVERKITYMEADEMEYTKILDVFKKGKYTEWNKSKEDIQLREPRDDGKWCPIIHLSHNRPYDYTEMSIFHERIDYEIGIELRQSGWSFKEFRKDMEDVPFFNDLLDVARKHNVIFHIDDDTQKNIDMYDAEVKKHRSP